MAQPRGSSRGHQGHLKPTGKPLPFPLLSKQLTQSIMEITLRGVKTAKLQEPNALAHLEHFHRAPPVGEDLNILVQ